MTTVNVRGVDGVIPTLDEGRWTMWSISDIYMGQEGQNKFIPKVKDYVIDPDTFTTYIVDSIDPVTYVPTLREIRPLPDNGVLPESEVLQGVGPGTQADTYRVYLDTSVTPHILSVDSRLRAAGSSTTYAKIFKGHDLSGNGKVISRLYDSQGRDLGENIPLEIVAIDNLNNYAIKIVPPCRTNESMIDGEVVTIVFYADDGHVVSKRQCLVENTNFIRPITPDNKYVSHIALETPFLDQNDPKSINVPIDTPVESLNLMGVVYYSDGSSLKLPVDGNKFIVFGLDQYVSTIVGQRVPLVLKYILSPEESIPGSSDRFITEDYTLITTNVDSTYKVMLQSYPEWRGMDIGYIPRFFITNADRNLWKDVTDYVVYEENTGPFNPKGYGILQQKAVTIDLKNVSPVYANFNHVQVINYLLESPPGSRQSNWRVGMIAKDDNLEYGNNVFAKKPLSTSNVVLVDSDYTDVDTWLDNVYWNTNPVYNPEIENKAPRPTHFIVMYKGEEVERSINEYNTPISFSNTITVEPNTNVYIRFIRKNLDGVDEVLAISGMMVVNDI